MLQKINRHYFWGTLYAQHSGKVIAQVLYCPRETDSRAEHTRFSINPRARHPKVIIRDDARTRVWRLMSETSKHFRLSENV